MGGTSTERNVVIHVIFVFETHDYEALVIGFDWDGAISAFNIHDGCLRAMGSRCNLIRKHISIVESSVIVSLLSLAAKALQKSLHAGINETCSARTSDDGRRHMAWMNA